MAGGDRGAEDGPGEMAAADAREHRIEVPRSARYYTLGAAGSHVRQLWLVCHGYGQLALPFLRAFDAIADPARLIVAPEALNRYYTEGGVRPHGPDSPVGATWMTREDRLADIHDYVRFLDLVYADALHGIDRGRTSMFALGFSQGAATVARWAARTAFELDHIVLWGSTLPPDLEPAPRLFRSADLTLVFGSRDTFTSAERIRDEQERLHAAGLACTVHRFDGGHRLDGGTLRQLAVGVPRN